jgi:hypothetical protein
MRAVLTRLRTMPDVVRSLLPTITLPGKSMVGSKASIPSTSDEMAVRLRSRAMASAGRPPNGAARNGLPAPKAVDPFAICLISDRMRTARRQKGCRFRKPYPAEWKDIIQKRLAFGRQQSGTVANSRR